MYICTYIALLCTFSGSAHVQRCVRVYIYILYTYIGGLKIKKCIKCKKKARTSSPEKQQRTIYSLNAAPPKLIVPHISNAHYYFLFWSKLDTRNTVKTSDYLYLNKEIYFIKPLKMFVPGAER